MHIHRIPVRTNNEYEGAIGRGLLEKSGALLIETVGNCKIAIITDSNIEALYLETVQTGLRQVGYDVCSFSFPAGEGEKRMHTLSGILEFLAENRLCRGDCVVALGGGVTGDLSGFAAGCYLRGVRYVQMPTTLLAAVDSSVGGKTAVDLSAGKNLAGLFYQPSLVVCDPDCFSTLPDEEFANGAAEAIKTGILDGESLFRLFETGDARKSVDEIVARCVAFKAGVVEADEFDSALRNTLNLGHTAGHAIEACSDYTIPHGQAVAIGLAIIAKAAETLSEATEPIAERIRQALIQNGLPVTSPYSAEMLAKAALSDKKRTGDSIRLVIPRRIGNCVLKTIPVGELLNVFRAGMEDDV
jgi:3-dehydroquinate synthase